MTASTFLPASLDVSLGGCPWGWARTVAAAKTEIARIEREIERENAQCRYRIDAHSGLAANLQFNYISVKPIQRPNAITAIQRVSEIAAATFAVRGVFGFVSQWATLRIPTA